MMIMAPPVPGLSSIVSTKRSFLFAFLVALCTFFVLIIELEHIHVVRYLPHQLEPHPSKVELSLSLFKHHIPRQKPDARLEPRDSEYEDHALPPLDSIVDQNLTIIGDPQPVLDFAIIGFGKCGTSTLLYEKDIVR
jgi:hypothetical protein